MYLSLSLFWELRFGAGGGGGAGGQQSRVMLCGCVWGGNGGNSVALSCVDLREGGRAGRGGAERGGRGFRLLYTGGGIAPLT